MYDSVDKTWLATFRYNTTPITVNDDLRLGMEVDSQNRLIIPIVNVNVHETMYNCSAEFSNGTKCGNTDVFDLTVFNLCECSLCVLIFMPVCAVDVCGRSCA